MTEQELKKIVAEGYMQCLIDMKQTISEFFDAGIENVKKQLKDIEDKPT